MTRKLPRFYGRAVARKRSRLPPAIASAVRGGESHAVAVHMAAARGQRDLLGGVAAEPDVDGADHRHGELGQLHAPLHTWSIGQRQVLVVHRPPLVIVHAPRIDRAQRRSQRVSHELPARVAAVLRHLHSTYISSTSPYGCVDAKS
jgi:hypothetical protein